MVYVSSACSRAKKISDILHAYGEAGITHVELSGGTGYYPQIEQDLQIYSKKYGMVYACHAYFPPPKEDFVANLASCNETIYKRSMEHYMECIALLTRIGCRTLSIHAGAYVEILPEQIGKELTAEIEYNHSEALDRFCRAYKILEKMCSENGIRMYLENNVLNQENYKRFREKNQLMMTDFETYKELKQQMDFNLLLDLGHLYVSAKTLNKRYFEECEKFAPDVRWIHISQNDGVFDQHRPIQEESEIFRAYHKFFDVTIPVTLETNGTIEQISASREILVKTNGAEI